MSAASREPVRLVGVRLRVADHLLHLVLAEAGAALDLDLLDVAGAHVLRGHVDDPVRVDVEGDLDLRHAARRGRDPDELELAERLVVGRHLRLALEDVHLDRGLVVLRGREDLGLLRRDGRVALDELRHHAAPRLDAERERGDVEQEDVLDLALEHAGLKRGADGDDLVGVDALVRVLADDLLDLLLHRRHAGHAADEDDVVDLRCVEAGVGERLLRRADRPLEQVGRDLLELRPRELQVEVLRAFRRRRDEGQVDLRRHRRRQLDLRLLGRLVQALERHLVDREVDALVALELGDHPVDYRLVEVVAAEMVVAGGRLDLEDAVAELEHRHVERAAAEVEDEDRLVGASLSSPYASEAAVGSLMMRRTLRPAILPASFVASRCALLKYAGTVMTASATVSPRYASASCLSFWRIIALISGGAYSLPSAVDAHVAVRALVDLVRDDRHLLGHLVELASHEALDREDRVLRVRDLLPPCGSADEPLAVLRERDDGRRRAPALGVRDDGRLATLEHGHARVRRAQVDADGLCHVVLCLLG